MASYFIHLMSNADVSRYTQNTPSTFVTRLDQEIFAAPSSTLSLAEISLQCEHRVNETGAIIKLIDWLYPCDDGLFGKLYEIDLGSLELPSAEALVSHLNYHLYKCMPRLASKRAKIFDYDQAMNRITVNFPGTDYYYTLMLTAPVLPLLGMEKASKKTQYTIIGRSKPAKSYRFNDETRTFSAECSAAWKSVEQFSNYFTGPPRLSPVVEAMVYCSIICDQPVSHTRQPLLRVVSLRPTSERITEDFGGRLQPIALRQTRISEIRIWLRNLYGEPLNLSSYTRITLCLQAPRP